MRLENNLYTVLTHDTGATDMRCSIRLNADSPVYRAHFPGKPVTPASCLVQTAQEICELLTGLRLEISRLQTAKFLHMLSPEETPTLTLTFDRTTTDTTTHSLSTHVTLHHDGVIFAKLSFTCHVCQQPSS